MACLGRVPEPLAAHAGRRHLIPSYWIAGRRWYVLLWDVRGVWLCVTEAVHGLVAQLVRAHA